MQTRADLSGISRLLNRSLKGDAACTEALTLALPEHGFTLLMIAASSDRADLVQRLLAPYALRDRARIIVSRLDCNGSSALVHAASLTRLGVLQALLRAVLVSVEAGGWEFHAVEGATDQVALADLGLTMERACLFPGPTQHLLRAFLADPWRFFGLGRGRGAAAAQAAAVEATEAGGAEGGEAGGAAAPSARAAPAQGALEEGSVEGWNVFAANERLFGVKLGPLSAEESAAYGLKEVNMADFSAEQVAAADAIAKEISASKQGAAGKQGRDGAERE